MIQRFANLFARSWAPRKTRPARYRMSMWRTRLLGGALLAATAFSAEAEVWRLSSMVSPESFEGQTFSKFAELVSDYTAGDLNIRIYPNGQIGSMETVVEQLSQGLIQLAPASASLLSRWDADIRYVSAPFLFDDYAHWSRFVQGELFASWVAKVEAASGITILGDIPDMPRGTFRTLLSKQPVHSIADVGALRIRQFNNALVIDAWTFLGAEVPGAALGRRL